jgi:RNA polymerase sigma factor for flagellar operon FliA
MSSPAANAQQLIADHQGLVRSLAWKIHRTLPRNIDIDDLLSYGQVGLAEAARDFDPARGNQFSTFAHYRIRGAIFDGLGKMSCHTRAQRRAFLRESAKNELLRVDAGDAHSAPQSLDQEINWLAKVATNLATVYLMSGDGDIEAAAPEDPAQGPDEQVISREVGDVLRQLLETLPPDASSLVKMVYYDELTLQEAGQRIGISKAWASRLHARTLEQLSRALRRLGISAA